MLDASPWPLADAATATSAWPCVTTCPQIGCRSYADSYHGLAMRGGSQSVANCASCHGVHNIFRSSDARSTVNAVNLPKTCGSCHAGAGNHFVIGPVHVQTASGPAHPVVKWIRGTYWLLIPLTLGFMVIHNLADFLAKLIRRRPQA